jgi:hypothetical protein
VLAAAIKNGDSNESPLSFCLIRLLSSGLYAALELALPVLVFASLLLAVALALASAPEPRHNQEQNRAKGRTTGKLQKQETG